MDKNTHLVHYKLFEPFKNVFAFTTTKQTMGIEKVRFSDFPENKAKLASTLGLNAESLVFPSQTHTNCVVEISELPERAINETDALVSNKTGICLCIQTADCVPVLLFDPVEKVIAAVHAGWRGTVGKIVENAVGSMVSNYGCFPENILAAIGPSISPGIYEVGVEVVRAAQKTIPNVTQTLQKNSSGNYQFNLWEANRQLLISNGLLATNIEILGECSFLAKEKCYSARRDGVETGRMVSGIMLRP
ncbi:peptidoglycan editing factor PgeF [Prolixibacteraceae bacterium Z1-6]|uniref:Purine nucleoside phosphorylase n=1 Tax=Draconibacterium aestuarii TaxID=2998507 RepID=A0A9X3FEY7_9BACT|nr:peptidoglycan editing factor PgeF [Prolixibacteraceae bacterium Z1-6]